MLRRGTKLQTAKNICRQWTDTAYKKDGHIEPRPKSVWSFYRQALAYLNTIKE